MHVELSQIQFDLLDESDLDALVALDSDPQILQYINGGRAQPRWLYQDHLLPAYIAITDKNPGMGCFAIRHPNHKPLLGICLLRPDFDEPQWCEIGYRLARAAWGSGLGTYAAQDMIRRALKLPEVDVICARIHQDNIASQRVAAKAGLRYDTNFEFQERTFANGKWVIPTASAVLYKARRGDWGQ